MASARPGGDVQSQAMLQVFLNIAEFGMPVQQAVEVPRISSSSFPELLRAARLSPGPAQCREYAAQGNDRSDAARGHDVEVWPRFPAQNGGVCAVMQHPETGQRHAGADPRREAYAAAW